MSIFKYCTYFTFNYKLGSIAQTRTIKRWVAPTLMELQKRKKKMGPEPLQHRATFPEWNYNAEIFAFGKRLNEDFQIDKLQQAFIHRSYIVQEELKQKNVGIEEPTIKLEDNQKLIERGEKLISDYVKSYLIFSLPKLPEDGIDAIYKYLTCENTLAHISTHLGTKDLALCADFPVSNKTLRDTLMAVIGALAESSNEQRAFNFIRDFICTQLNQKDLMEIWDIKNPLERLISYCKENKMGEPELRLIGEIGKNTVLATYNIGVYNNKKFIGSGFGESVQIATDMAAMNTLRSFCGIGDNMRPFDFSLEVEKVVKQYKIQ